MTSQTKIFLESTFKAMADREIKRGSRKYKNLNISRTKRAFQMKSKTSSIGFEGLSFGFGEKLKFHKKQPTQALNELNLTRQKLGA